MSTIQLPDSIQAVVATPEAAQPTERRTVALPEPAADEALVAVRAFAVNRGELTLLGVRGDGWRPGQDVAGEVVRPAADGSGPPVGTRVAGLAEWHGWAQAVPVPTRRLAPIPDGVDDAHAAALPMAGTTAFGLVEAGGALLGRRVAIVGAAGGVGHLAVQIAAGAGARVTAVARSEHAERLRAWGAERVVAELAELEDAQDLILESAGGASVAAAIAKVAPGGTVVLFGNSSRERTSVDFVDFAGGHEEARIGTYFSGMHEAQAGARLRVLLAWLDAGRIEVEIGFEGDWDRLNDAIAGLRERRVHGKAVLVVPR